MSTVPTWKKIITPSFGDIDGLGHVNNCVVPRWFENAREPAFRLFHPDLNLGGWSLIMAKVTIEYISQIRLGTDVEIRTYIKKIGRSSFTVYQEAWQGGTLGSKGDAVLVHYDFENLKSIPIPDHIVAEMKKHMVDEDNPNLRTRSARFPARG